MDSLDEAMKKLQTDKKDGFTLTESLTVVVLVGILSAVAIASYNQQWAQERLLRASRETHTWLENQRLTAIKEGQAAQSASTQSQRLLTHLQKLFLLRTGF